jgi:hypothetical protein
MSTADPKPLDSHHRDTLLQLFQHPTSHNIEWHDVLSLLEAVGSVEPLSDGKFRAHLGDETEVLVPPGQKDIDAQQVVDLRRMLARAGYETVVEELQAKGKEV